MEIIKKPRNLQEQALQENAVASSESNKALIDFLSMMTGIEIPTETHEMGVTSDEE